MNFFEVKRNLRDMGIVLKASYEFGEYRVSIVGESGDSSYFTDDLDDAWHTGCAMAQR